MNENANEKVLVTGASGFVGRHLCARLLERGVEVWGTGRREKAPFSENGFFYVSCDLRPEGQIDALLRQQSFSHIVHLVGQSDVGASWTDPMGTLFDNFIAAARLLEAVRNHGKNVRKILLIGSLYEYDTSHNTVLTESSPLRPHSPYGWSKLLQSALGKMYADEYGLPVLSVRMTNLLGPGAKAGLPVQIARQIVQAEQAGEQHGLSKPIDLTLGSLYVKRDFLDVRDAVDALSRLLVLKCAPGEVFNLCSGRPVSVASLLFRLKSLVRTDCQFQVNIDPSLLRPCDPAYVCGSHEKLTRYSGWKPEISLQRSLKDLLEEVRQG